MSSIPMRAAKHLPLVVVTLLAAHCSNDSGAEDGNAPARRAVLASIGERVVLPTYRDFTNATQGLVTTLDAYAASLEPDDLQAAQDAWVEAMEIWERAEVMQFGPAADAGGGTPGGRDLRDAIYSWPFTNECFIDQATLAQTYADSTTLEAEAVTRKGLDAIEYLLFQTDPANQCAPSAEINASGDWDALGAEEIQQRRADYAAAAAALVDAQAQELLSAWEPTEGNFLAAFGEAGEDTSVYATSQQALNSVGGALFYLEAQTKDMKLAEPAGLKENLVCLAGEVCPEILESPWANRSKEHVLNNLRGFAQVFRGGDTGDPAAQGFDDLLGELGPEAETLAAAMNARIDSAIAVVEGTEGTFAEALATDPQPLIDIHTALTEGPDGDPDAGLTDLMKNQFLALLNISLPPSNVGDNDS